MSQADQGVLLVSLGTIAYLGKDPYALLSENTCILILHNRGEDCICQCALLDASSLTEQMHLECRGAFARLQLSQHAGHKQIVQMAAAFAELKCKVLWRLTSAEMPDKSSGLFHLGNNTQVCGSLIPQ